MYDLVARKLATCFVMGMGLVTPESGLTFLYAVSRLFRVALVSGSFKFQVLSFKLKTDKITDADLRWLVLLCGGSTINYKLFLRAGQSRLAAKRYPWETGRFPSRIAV